MKRHVIVLLAAVFFMGLLYAGDAECDTFYTEYNYGRTPDPNSHASLEAYTAMYGLRAPNATAGTPEPEGKFLTDPYTSGSEPSTLLSAFDQRRQPEDYLGNPTDYRFMYSTRKFDSPDSVSFSTANCNGTNCARTIYAFPAQNPLVNVSGYASAGDLQLHGATAASATGSGASPVAKTTEKMAINNSFTLGSGTSGLLAGATSRLTVSFRLNGTLRADTNAYSHMDASFNITTGPENNILNILSVTGDANLNNNPTGQLGHGIATTPTGTGHLAYSTNTGTNVVNDPLPGITSIYGYDTGVLTLYFDALVGTTYDLTLALNLLSEAYGNSGAEGVSLTDFSNTLGPSIFSTDGTVLLWDVPPTNSTDTTPDSFTFTDQTNVELNTTGTSNTITVSGINAATPISITGGTYSINGGSYTSVDGTVSNGNTVTVQLLSSGSYTTTTNATLTIGGVSDTFSVTTQAAPASDSGGNNSGCFIATAAFGSPMAGQVEILRQFRDRYLLTNDFGRKFVAWYYRNGPVAADYIKDKPLAKATVRVTLYPLIGFSLLLISGILPFVIIGLLLSALLFLRFRPKKVSAT